MTVTMEIAQVETRDGQWGSVMGTACREWGQGLGPTGNPKPEKEGLRSKKRRGGTRQGDKN